MSHALPNGQAIAGHGHAHAEPQVAARAMLRHDLVHADKGQWGMLSAGLMLAGVALVIITIVIGASGGEGVARQAVSAYHTGFLYCLGLSLGCLGIQMIFQQFNAGWAAAVRRQAENLASLIWWCAILFAPVAILNVFVLDGHSKIFGWMDPHHTAGDLLYEHKKAWLNEPFWLFRAGVYFSIWTILALTLYRLSRRQDQTGDRWLTARARFISSWGLLLFALTTAFASFDWLMSMDYHWFSTMFGVYFFAGCVVSSLAILIIVLGLARMAGKLEGVFTADHFHDIGKLLLAFTVFWAYVSFSQYFLIWYSNIPEETAFYNLRKQGGYQWIGVALCFGHFIIPFLLLLWRNTKRNYRLLMFVAAWQLVMHAVDVYYMARPNLSSPIDHGIPLGERLYLDVIGLLGPVLLFLGLVLRKVASAPLIALKDPRLHEALAHKNYV